MKTLNLGSDLIEFILAEQTMLANSARSPSRQTNPSLIDKPQNHLNLGWSLVSDELEHLDQVLWILGPLIRASR